MNTLQKKLMNFIILGVILIISGMSLLLINLFVEINTTQKCMKYKTLCRVTGDAHHCNFSYMNNTVGCEIDDKCPFKETGINITCYFDKNHIGDYHSCPKISCPDPYVFGRIYFFVFVPIVLLGLIILMTSILKFKQQSNYVYLPNYAYPKYMIRHTQIK